MSGYGAFAGELGFDFLPDCLVLTEGPMNKREKKRKKVNQPHPSWTAFSWSPSGRWCFGNPIRTTWVEPSY